MAAQITPRKRTLDLQEAADFLKISKEALRRKVCKGLIRGAKPGKCWAFLEDDLVDYFQSLYPKNRKVASLTEKAEVPECSTNAAKRGGLTLLRPTASEYEDHLARKSKLRRKNFMTPSKHKHGDRLN
ncbi:helix-turn-helix domain-containing protein [Acidithiobacillus thiooxidans]|uniref:helix-turn-helix domain-containing protein n=1 Tax=Acidithiobacillus thiooxidans TaxID=930 RepID=UPI001D0352B3|nr:helix-turn-helix domain-containing protein [Acidithiobacillus thiooxidans]